MIQIKNLNIKYAKDNKISVSDFEVSAGDCIFLSGNSGSGKSIFLKSLIHLYPMSYETYLYLQKDIQSYPATELRKNIMYLNQQPHFPHGSVESFIKLIENYKIHKDSVIDLKQQILQTIKLLNRDESLFKKDINSLSGGETQIIQMAIALALDPHILILDEAFSAMDNKTHILAERLSMSWLEKSDKSIIFTSHQIELCTFNINHNYQISNGIVTCLN